MTMGVEDLRPHTPRRFVPEDADLGDPSVVARCHERLLGRDVGTREDLEAWVRDRSELEAALDQYGTLLYIRMTCRTDDPRRAAAYRRFEEEVRPVVKPLTDRLNRRYLEWRRRFGGDARRYEVYDRAHEADVRLFRPENVPLETEESLLEQEYQTICGAMTVHFRGRERTMPEMGRFLEEPDRALREEAWRATARRRGEDARRLEVLFDRMRSLRERIARAADFPNFRDYQFARYHRFDYGPEACRAYHRVIADRIVPLWEEVLERRRRMLGVTALRPWDLAVDPLGRPPLRPFATVDELVRGVGRILERVHPSFGGRFGKMAAAGLLDLESRKGKAPGGYQSTLAEARKPFIFMNAVGIDDDVRTLLHESGHALHALACAEEPIVDYRHAPMEFCEVASMSMELLGGGHLDVFYEREEDRLRSRRTHLEGVVHVLVWVALVDAFQHWIYEHPGHTPRERTDTWVELYRRFAGRSIDWSGLEETLGRLWHRQLHIFEVPFYYIEYGIAQLGAVNVWRAFEEEGRRAVERFHAALTLGGSRPLPELFAAAGLRFDFSEAAVAPVAALLARELGSGT